MWKRETVSLPLSRKNCFQPHLFRVFSLQSLIFFGYESFYQTALKTASELLVLRSCSKESEPQGKLAERPSRVAVA